MTSFVDGFMRSPFFTIINIPRRFVYALSYYRSVTLNLFSWLFSSKEYTNFTYDLTDKNTADLADFLAVALGGSHREFRGYIDEIRSDRVLAAHVRDTTRTSDFRSVSDEDVKFGRRVGWYAAVRHLKPAVVIETGVEKGLGGVVLCSALLRNAAEGHPGRYYGTDINPRAGWLLTGAYRTTGEILVGDSIESLKKFTQPVDLFINDSDHSADYEAAEYEVIEGKLAATAVIIGDNSHYTDKLGSFSREKDRNYLFFKEEPAKHWYPGGGIGISFPKKG